MLPGSPLSLARTSGRGPCMGMRLKFKALLVHSNLRAYTVEKVQSLDKRVWVVSHVGDKFGHIFKKRLTPGLDTSRLCLSAIPSLIVFAHFVSVSTNKESVWNNRRNGCYHGYWGASESTAGWHGRYFM